MKTIDELIEFSKDLEASAYGWNIGGKVLGYDVGEFEDNCYDIAKTLEQMKRIMNDMIKAHERLKRVAEDNLK